MNRHPADSLFVTAAGREWEPAGAGVRRKVLGYDDRIMMVRVEFEKDAIGSVHSHPHRQVTYIVAGSFEVRIGEETRDLGSGDSFFVPPDIPHGVVAHEQGCLVDVFTPARQEFVGKTQ